MYIYFTIFSPITPLFTVQLLKYLRLYYYHHIYSTGIYSAKFLPFSPVIFRLFTNIFVSLLNPSIGLLLAGDTYSITISVMSFMEIFIGH